MLMDMPQVDPRLYVFLSGKISEVISEIGTHTTE